MQTVPEYYRTTVLIRRNLTGNTFANGKGTGTEQVQNGYKTDTEQIPNRNGTDTEWLQITKMEKSVLQNANYKKRRRSSEHMVVSYAIRVLTKDLETM